jgi:hypothetical protein
MNRLYNNINKFCLLEFLEYISESLPNNSIHNLVKNKLNNDKEISIYKNKINLFTKLNHICECPICYETKLNIDLNCGLCFCTDCYIKIYKKSCPICRY